MLSGVEPTQASEIQFGADTSVIVAQHLGDSVRSEETLQLHAKLEWQHQAWQLVADGRARANNAYDGKPPYSEAAKQAYQFSSDWRELYLARTLNHWTVRLGWQQVVWGRADNLRVLDQVNPLDYRDFVLPDLGDYRISTPMLQAIGSLGEWSMEVLLVTAFEPNRYPEAGSEFDLKLEQPLLDAGFTLGREKSCTSCMEAGLHASRTFAGTDISLVYFATRDDDPVYHLQNDGVTLRREFARQQQLGAGVAHTLPQGFVLRGETSVIPDYAYTRVDTFAAPANHLTVRYLLGLDYLWRDWLMAMQLQDRYIQDWSASLLADEKETIYTASVTGSTHNAQFEHRVAVSLLDDGRESLWQIRSTWKPTDRYSVGIALDLFAGKPRGLFGQFDAKDRLRAEIKYYF